MRNGGHATPNPINVYGGFGVVYTGLYAALFNPGAAAFGTVQDPQLGAQSRFTTFDISGGESENWSQELRLQSNFDGPFNFNVGAIYIDYKSDGDYYVMGNTLTAAAQVENNCCRPSLRSSAARASRPASSTRTPNRTARAATTMTAPAPIT
jgi:outer membrane receptor protein involved in Fe transport